ncbi:MAG TPA: hypothetical protein PJ994_04555 [Tepidiformaceae bacterium]|nr:hypothetical protein [Tepidiformaceae bacterium]
MVPFFEQGLPVPIPFRYIAHRVDATVDLDGELRPIAIEVEYEWANRMLTAPLQAVQLAAT